MSDQGILSYKSKDEKILIGDFSNVFLARACQYCHFDWEKTEPGGSISVAPHIHYVWCQHQQDMNCNARSDTHITHHHTPPAIQHIKHIIRSI